MDYPDYLLNLQEQCNSVYTIAEEARRCGKDPKNCVEIPQAHDLADRTQKLLNFLHERDTAQQIRNLTKTHKGNREMVAIDIARIVAAETYLYGISTKCNTCKGKGVIKQDWRENDCPVCKTLGMSIEYEDIPIADETLMAFNSIEEFEDRKKVSLSIYHGVCAGLAVLTEGILVAPLEGVVSARLIPNKSGTECVSITFAGPIRSAGGTGQALSVLIGDILRRMFKLAKSEVTPKEIERYKEEVSIYARGLQYRPSNAQLEMIAKKCPIYLDGEGVGKEVSGQRDLPRVETNKVREGCILVMCEGMVLKAPKILKYVRELELDGWESSTGEILPSYKYLSDVLAGRPVFGQPMREGGFRLRYGRSRLAGLAATSIHPATMKVLGGFLIPGTQMKYERPGKATVVTPCDTIDGPYVQFLDGTAKRINHSSQLPEGLPIDIDWDIEKVWDLGEILVPVGEFIENNHNLMASPYNEDWHKRVLEKEGLPEPTDFLVAKEQAKKIPMHPKYVAMFSDLSPQELKEVFNGVDRNLKVGEEVIDSVYRLNIDVKRIKGTYVITGETSKVFIDVLEDGKRYKGEISRFNTGVEFINSLAEYEIRPKVTYRIGGRMGKPEGAKLREMKPPIHVLHPLGMEVGSQRKVIDAIKKRCEREVGLRLCNSCKRETHYGVCCGENTEFQEIVTIKTDLTMDWIEAKQKVGIHANLPIKGVKGMMSSERCPENLIKGILRFNNGISVFRDGTIRFDMVDMTMTHFKPSEVGLTTEKASELGYVVSSPDEVTELFPQDIVISKTCAEIFLRTTQYIDQLLVHLYDMQPFYKCQKIEDLFGHLCMGLAPHTSGAILCRLIGVAKIKGHYGHPFFHAGKRRNCDGDIDSVLLLMDGLLNFSRAFLSTHRGGHMDAPLILTTRLDPSEIDKEALNVDISSHYTEEFYELTQTEPPPKEALQVGVEIVESRLGSECESRGMGYTHGTTDCSAGPKNNPYNTLDSMRQKTLVQFALGTKLVSVDNEDQSSRLIDRHLIRDMRGNLRAFGQQKVRCTKCGTSYRRVPITGNCATVIDSKEDPFTGESIEVICPGNVILTVTQGGVKKYDSLMEELIEKYGCNDYTEKLYRMASSWVKETFRVENKKKQMKLW